MNDENPEFDARLEELFRREHTHLPAEPFATSALRALAAERKRRVLAMRLLQAAGLIILIALSPLLMNGSIWVAMRLDELTANVSAWLTSPFLLAGVVLVALAAFATKWARLW